MAEAKGTDRRKWQHLYGPVPSRRLGLSLGVDPVPLKTCSLDCVYCQLGPTTELTFEPQPYAGARKMIAELEEWFGAGGEAAAVTLAGSGEPTLSTEIGAVVEWARAHLSVPIAVLTNGTLLWQCEVRESVRDADLLLPSLDASTGETFRRINRPADGLTLGMVVEGLMAARHECTGAMWLETMLVAGVNDGEDEVRRLREWIQVIRPDRVDINTVTRPPAEPWARPASVRCLRGVARFIGPLARVVAPADAALHGTRRIGEIEETVLGLLRRRPCRVPEMAASLGLHANEVAKCVAALAARGLVVGTVHDREGYFRPA